KGPYKYWTHFHEFIPNKGGVLMKDTVDYELPFGFFGKMAHLLFVKNKLAYIFDFRYDVLEKKLNTMRTDMAFLIVLLTFTLMEGATWIIHKYVMHGFLWFLHRDHHDHSSEGVLEKNDYFFVIFAIPTIALM